MPGIDIEVQKDLLYLVFVNLDRPDFLLTFDIMFEEEELYRKVKETKAITPQLFMEYYGVSREQITDFLEYDAGLSFKITIRRPVPSGDIGDTDIYGCQQYAPLLDVEIPL